MKEKILIAVICGLVLMVVGIFSYVMLVPTIEPENTNQPVQNVFQPNELPGRLGINRPNKEIPRIFAIRNYESTLEPEEINNIGYVRYHILDNNAKGHMLILPFDVGGRITVTELMWDDYSEKYVPSTAEDAVVIDDQILQGYSLLLQYDRPSSNPEYEIKITQGSETATYIIEPIDGKLEEYEFIKRD